MKNKILKGMIVSAIVCMIMQTSVFAGTTLPESELPAFNVSTIVFDQDGHVKFVPSTITTPSIANPAYKWKQFHIELLKRTTTLNSAGATVFTWKKVSTTKVKADENEADLKITSVGYYQVGIRGEELNGNYSVFVRQDGSKQTWNNTSEYTGGNPTYGGVEVDEDHIGAGGSSSGTTTGGSNVDINGGPGVVQSMSTPIQGYQYAIIGPNGQIMGYFGGNQSNNGYANMNQYSQNSSQYYGPAYTNNMQGAGQTLYPNTGINNYPTVQAPNVYGTNGNYTQTDPYNQQYNQQYSGQYNQQYNNQQSSVYNPNYSTANNNYTPGNNSYMTPQITQGLEIGWHVDQNGRFYYQGNGVVLKSTWYLIDGKYFRFGDNGYLLANQWFKDQSTGSWYFLAGDGAMLTGWQNLNGVWYYFKPENGNGYGTMYSNTTISINDPVWGYGEYAFDVNGAMVKNAWYGGRYYGNDGRRQN